MEKYIHLQEKWNLGNVKNKQTKSIDVFPTKDRRWRLGPRETLKVWDILNASRDIEDIF